MHGETVKFCCFYLTGKRVKFGSHLKMGHRRKLVCTWEITRCHIQEEHNLHIRYRSV